MSKDPKPIKNVATTIKSFSDKWRGFLIGYGIVNVIAISVSHGVVDSIYNEYFKLFVSDLNVDGANFSIFANLFALPLIIGLSVVTILFYALIQLGAAVLFKVIYLKSAAPKDEREKLYRQQRWALLGYGLLALICALFLRDSGQIMLAMGLYWPVPLMTYVMVTDKIRRQVTMTEYGQK